MAQDYNFTFQNLNPTTTGWTGGSIQQTLADLRNTPFDPLDKSEMIDDTTAGSPNGGAGVEVLNLAQGQGMLKSVDNVIKNLQKASKKASDLDTLKYYNEQLLEAQKERDRIQAEVVKFGGSATGKKKGGGGSNGLLDADLGGVSRLFGGGLGGLFGSDKELTPAQKAALLTKRVAKDDSKLDIAQDKLDAHKTSIDSLQAAIAKATDPKVIGHLQKQLQKEQQTLAKDQSKFDAQTAHRTELQNKLVAINPPVAGTPGATPGATPATTPGATPAAAAVKAPNYWDELVDKALGTRSGASGWHSSWAPTPVTPAVAPAVVPAVTPEVIPAVVPATPAVIPAAPAVIPGVLPAVSPVLSPKQLRRQQRLAKLVNPLLPNVIEPPPGATMISAGSGWT